MFRSAALVLTLLSATRATAESPVPVVRAEVSRSTEVEDVEVSPPLRRIGFSLTAGIPSGAAGELVVRPWRALRLHLGGAYDLASGGLVGGITIAPIRFPISPVLELSGGHFFEGDASGLFSSALRGHAGLLPPLRRVGYDFAAAELGFELGNPDAFVFTVRAGLAVVQGTVHELGAAVPAVANVVLADLRVRAVIPSVRLGFVFFL